ncbi:MAG TPA: ATP-binding protein [Actinomycetota bacterium]
MIPSVDLEVACGPEAAARARDALDGLGDRLEPELQENLRLLVSELVTNSVRHAGLRRGTPITITADVGRAGVRVTVIDPGPGFVPPAGPPEPDAEGGWGLYLVDRISDRWGVERDRATRVWFEIDRAGPAR